MDSLSPQVVFAAKLSILNPNEFDLWKIRIEQYFLMTDYSLWEVILNGDSPVPTRVVEGVLQPVAPTTAEQSLDPVNPFIRQTAKLRITKTQFPLNYEPEPSYIQDYNSYPHDSSSSSQQYLCCDNCGGLHETFQCKPTNQNFYNSNSSGSDQSQTSQFSVIHPPPQETSIEILHDHENVINSVQTFLRKFNRYSFFETPKVLLLAWDRVFEIKDALGTTKNKLEDLQELFRELSDDVQNIHEELAEYINTPGWNHPAFYDDNDDDNELAEYINTPSWNRLAFYNYDYDDDEDYTIAITPEEPVDSLIMEDEHLDTISATKSDEVIKSSVEDLVPIPSESEGIPNNTCDMPFCDNSPPLHILKDQFEISPILTMILLRLMTILSLLTKSIMLRHRLLILSSDSFFEKSNTSLSYSNNSLPEFETFSDHMEETSSGSTNTHADNSLPKYDLFLFEIELD
nr:hypothetical protein [Tanacetum cinerariifolium]